MAYLIKQDHVLRREFQERINRKVQKNKDQMKNQIDEDVPAFVAWAVKPLAGFLFDREQLKRVEKGDSGEFNVFLHAKFRLSNKWVILNDVVVEPEPDVLTQIDHIIIGPPGLFIIETKAWGGSYKAYRDRWEYRNGKQWFKCSSHPTKQNAYHAKAIGKWLEGTGILKIDAPVENWILPVVVFTRAQRLKTIECSMPIFNGISELIAYLNKRPERYLNQEDIEKLATLIQYPTLNKALRYDQIKWTGMDATSLAADRPEDSRDLDIVRAEDLIKSKPSDLPEHTEGLTKDGKRYVRVPGLMKQAIAVFEHYKERYPNLEPPRKDRFKNDMFFFYLP